MTGDRPMYPLRGHCVLNPRGTIIPDRRPLSLGNRGRGNGSCTQQSTSADDSEDTTDHRKSLCVWGQLSVHAVATSVYGWVSLRPRSSESHQKPDTEDIHAPASTAWLKTSSAFRLYWAVHMFRTAASAAAAAAAQKRKCKSNEGWKGNLQPTNFFLSSDWNYSRHHCVSGSWSQNQVRAVVRKVKLTCNTHSETFAWILLYAATKIDTIWRHVDFQASQVTFSLRLLTSCIVVYELV